MIVFANLPIDLLLQIKSYLTELNYLTFLLTSNRYFGNIRRQTRYYSLNALESYRFCLFEDFREEVKRSIHDPRHQIQLRLNETTLFRSSRTGEAETFVNVHRAILRDYRGDLSYLRYLQQAEFSGDVPSLEEFPIENNLLTLILTDASRITEINRSFAFLRQCKLIRCHNMKNILGVYGIPDVEINHCMNLEDFSGLGNHERLVLKGCYLLLEIPSLGTTQEVTVSGCPNVTNVSQLFAIPKVKVSSCSKLKDIQHLGNHKHIMLQLCDSIANANSLCSCHEVILISCRNIEVIDRLGDVPHLTIEHCNASLSIPIIRNEFFRFSPNSPTHSSHYDFDGLTLKPSAPNIRQHIEFQNGYINDLEKLRYLYSLTIGRCSSIEDISCLAGSRTDQAPHIQRLILENCPSLKVIEGFHSMQLLRIRSCEGIRTIQRLENIESIEIKACPSLHNVSFFTNVKLFCLRHRESHVFRQLLKHQPVFEFEKIETLILDGWNGCYEMIGRGDVKRLVLIKCEVYRVTIEGNVNRLEADNCSNLSSLNDIPMIRMAKIRCCNNLTMTGIESLQRSEQVFVDDCEKIESSLVSK